MKVVKTDKEYSWLELPVVLDGYHKMAHITLKFFGTAAINIGVVELMVSQYESSIENYDLDDFEFEPAIFINPDGTHLVLKLTDYPYYFSAIHQQFDLIKDDHVPYIPHITVDKDYWQIVVGKGLKFKDVVKAIINETQLYVGKYV